MTVATRLHPDLDRAIGILGCAAPAAAARAEATLGRMLVEVRDSPLPEHAWHASELTGDGFPVEFTLTSAGATIGYTVAPWPDAAQGERLARAGELVADLTGTGPAPATLGALVRFQTGGGLRYGAWVGARHPVDGSRDRFKLYAEVSAAAADVSAAGDDPTARLEDRRARLRMVGHEPATGRDERYHRVRRMMPHHLRRAMDGAGLGGRAGEMLALIERAAARPIAHGLPGGSVGFSVARSPTGPNTVTVYLFARALWSGDARIRRGLLRLARDYGWSLGAYEEMSAPLAARDVHRTFHGLVGLSVSGDRPIQLAVGLRPPPLDARP